MIKALLLGMPESSPRFNVVMSVPNLGIVSLAGNVDPTICDIKVADLFPVKNWESYVMDILRECTPDIVGLSFMSFQYRGAIKLSKIIKDYDKNIKVVIGGYHPTLMYEEMSESPDFQNVDFIVRGEGEGTFRELVEAMNNDIGYEKIKGLSYRNNDKFYHNPPRELLDPELIQLPNRSSRLIKKGFTMYGLPSDSLETSRGCTYKCKFCSISKMYGRNFRTYEIDRVINDIKNAKENGAKAIFISDDNITLDLRRLELLSEEIINQKLNSIHYAVQTTVKGMASSEKLVQKMADAGMKTVFIGIESVKKDNLDYLAKSSSSWEDTKKAIKYLRDNNIITSGGFILGMPDDDEKALWDIYDIAWELKIDVPFFSILIPHLKTEIREELIAQGYVTNPDEYHKYELFSANIRTKYLSPEDLDRIVSEMYLKYLANLRYLWFSQIRKTFPLFYWKSVFGQIPYVIRDLVNIIKEGKKLKNE
jgi:radical SAM superfamily enzyme YgiQ (UPF0313 family)